MLGPLCGSVQLTSPVPLWSPELLLKALGYNIWHWGPIHPPVCHCAVDAKKAFLSPQRIRFMLLWALSGHRHSLNTRRYVYNLSIQLKSHPRWITKCGHVSMKTPRPPKTWVRVCSVAKFCLTLCDPTDRCPLVPSVLGIFQARILEWVAISSFRASSQLRDQTYVSCISWVDRQILHHWGTWEAQDLFVVQLLSRVWLFVTSWTAVHLAFLSFTISWSLLKLTSTESVMPSNHLIHCHPLLFLPSIFLSIRIFSNESALRIGWLKYWNFSFSVSTSNENSGLISFRIDWLDLLAVQRTLKSLL